MKKLSIYLIVTLFIVSCGRSTDKSGHRDAAITSEKTSHEKLTDQQEKAVKEKYLTKGKEIATATQAELLKVVQGAIASGGPAYAVTYCNVEALPLKDSLSALYNCTIQRLSTKYRNPADKPLTEIETEQLKSYEIMHGKGETLTPAVYIVGEEVEYYQAINIASGACLLCHGDPATQIAEETLSTIRELYPNDLATGYALNDFRGVWKITFLYDFN